MNNSKIGGAVPSQQLERLVALGVIKTDVPLDTNQIQPASIDLRLGRKAYRVRSSFLPGRDRTVSDCLRSHRTHKVKTNSEIDLGCGMRANCIARAETLQNQ